MNLIINNEQLSVLIENLEKKNIIALDTEFRRCSTYYPQICLIQLYDFEQSHIIDVLAEDLDLTILHQFLQRDDVVKIFHDASQDIEVFWHSFGYVPKRIFDTQIASDLCSLGESLSYQKMVKLLLNVEVSKEMQFTNWQKRPLSKKQLEYAALDVEYLGEIYHILSEILKGKGRQKWHDDLVEEMCAINKLSGNPEKLFSKMKFLKDDNQFLKILRNLTRWREEKAQKFDVPRMRIMTNEDLCQIAMHKPLSLKELKKCGIENSALDDFPEELLEIVAFSLENDDVDLLRKQKMKKSQKFQDRKKEILNQLKEISEKLGISAQILGDREEIENFILCEMTEQKSDVRFLYGWRFDEFGCKIHSRKSSTMK